MMLCKGLKKGALLCVGCLVRADFCYKPIRLMTSTIKASPTSWHISMRWAATSGSAVPMVA